MSKLFNCITFAPTTTMRIDDQEDMRLLGTFMLALSRTDLSRFGVKGAAVIEYHSGDYWLKFEGGFVIARPTKTGALLFHRAKCPCCTVTTWSSNFKAAFCTEHRNDLLDLNESAWGIDTGISSD